MNNLFFPTIKNSRKNYNKNIQLNEEIYCLNYKIDVVQLITNLQTDKQKTLLL